MIEIPSLRPETRYGMPTADQLLFNRQYIIGYSYLYKQARWAMEVIDRGNKPILLKRGDSFRPDLRVPSKFRAGLEDYAKSGHDRGHLVSSADRRASEIANSETFLLSNMSPQKGDFNRRIWKKLEEEVRLLAFDFVEVYAICGPLFDIGKKIDVIGDMMNPNDKNDVRIPIPHAYFKSILAETVKGKLSLWTFVMNNEKLTGATTDYLKPTVEVERRAGLSIWDRMSGVEIDKLKSKGSSASAFKTAVANGTKLAAEKQKTRKELAEKYGLAELGRATEFLSENAAVARLLDNLKHEEEMEDAEKSG